MGSVDVLGSIGLFIGTIAAVAALYVVVAALKARAGRHGSERDEGGDRDPNLPGHLR